MKGRKPQPTQIQIVKGDPSKFGKGKLQEKLAVQPIPTEGLMDPPEHLTGRALGTYKFWREELEAMNLSKKPDAQMLEGACVFYARAVEADIEINAQGTVLLVGIYNKQGDEVGSRPIINPYTTVSNAAWEKVKAFCSEFGLSPVSRTRLSIEKKNDEDADLQAELKTLRADIGAIQ